MDFVSYQLFNGTWFRTPTVVDVLTRERLVTNVGQSIKGADVVYALAPVSAQRDVPKIIAAQSFHLLVPSFWLLQPVKVIF